MSNEEKVILCTRISAGLKSAHERMLRHKALLGQNVVYADSHGNPCEVSAREALKKLLAQRV